MGNPDRMSNDKSERTTGGRLNIKMPSYQYRDSHDKDKTVSRPSYLYHKNHHTWKDDLYIEAEPCGPVILLQRCDIRVDIYVGYACSFMTSFNGAALTKPMLLLDHGCNYAW